MLQKNILGSFLRSTKIVGQHKKVPLSGFSTHTIRFSRVIRIGRTWSIWVVGLKVFGGFKSFILGMNFNQLQITQKKIEKFPSKTYVQAQ